LLSCLIADENFKSTKRKLDRKLVLIVQQIIGGKPLWILPQTFYNNEDSLKEVGFTSVFFFFFGYPWLKMLDPSPSTRVNSFENLNRAHARGHFMRRSRLAKVDFAFSMVKSEVQVALYF
jgi:hypothetical protein